MKILKKFIAELRAPGADEIESRLVALESQVIPKKEKGQASPSVFWYDVMVAYWAPTPKTILERVGELEAEVAKTKDRFNALLKHLNIEYYKQEIKETNGHTTEKVVEGFRKPKKEKKKKDDIDEDDDY